jgi:3,4-dihydroxy-2-butanone 4-phosphate synthase
MSTTLIERLNAIIETGEVSRAGLARAAGLHPNSLRKLGHPDWNPTADTLGRLEKLIQRGTTDLLVGTEAIINEARNGRMFILVDDESRENEGDLVIPAQMATPEAINFMARHGRGLICLALGKERADQLGLEPMARTNRSRMETAFTVSIEAKEGISTGISAADRARTVAVAIDSANGPDAIVSPGHVFPLVAKPGGVLVRAGHTEAAVDVSRLAGLNPSGVICEIMREDGTMARQSNVEQRLVGKIGAAPDEDHVAMCALKMNVSPRVFARDPLRFARRQRDFSIDRQRELERDPRPSEFQACKPAGERTFGRIPAKPKGDFDASAAQAIDALPGGAGVRVLKRDCDARRLRVEQEVGACWSARALVGAWLQCHIDTRPCDASARLVERNSLGMGAAPGRRRSSANNSTARRHDDAADVRVGRTSPPRLLCQSQRFGHEALVGTYIPNVFSSFWNWRCFSFSAAALFAMSFFWSAMIWASVRLDG